MFVSLPLSSGKKISYFLRSIILSSVDCLGLPYFSILSQKSTIFEKKKKKSLLNIQCVLASFKILSEIFVFLIRNRRDIITTVQRTPPKVLIIPVIF